MSVKSYVIIDNQTDYELNLKSEKDGGIGQDWHNVPSSLASGANNSSNPAYLDGGIDMERGDLIYINQGNNGEIDLHISHRHSTNKVSVSADANTVAFRTKIKGGSWSDWGTVVQGSGDFYVEFKIS